jgi:hypothetical protein
MLWYDDDVLEGILEVEADWTSETSVSNHNTPRRHNPQDLEYCKSIVSFINLQACNRNVK